MLNLSSESPYDVIVCGGGHAGCEAALASARMGAKTLLLSGNIDTVAQMSCNPAIGGLAKGHIVREIDALGGEMAVNSDATGIQFRVLNASKGVAVQSPRAQCDKKAYQFRMKSVLEATPNLSFFQAVATAIITDGKVIRGVKTNLGADFYGKTVVLTTGTFLKGLMHVGSSKTEGGRMGDFSALTLSDSLAENGIEIGRLKTGTPARISGKSIDFSKCAVQYGDNPPTLFGFYDTRDIPVSENSPCPTHDENSKMFHVEQSLGWAGFVGFGREQLACYETSTNEKTAEIIHKNLHRSAMYGGEIKGIGPRYCPSIEDKIVRFSHKDGHRLFLEPEGRFTDEWYINGLSTSMPLDVQVDIIHSVAGLENAEIFRPAYAVEYDFAPPTQLYPTLESRIIEGLFCADQINGTSGYEEAAGQGLIAGANAAAKVFEKEPIVLKRHESYIGVLIDDLVTKGTKEPYRMFTSRAEYRLLLNHGGAEYRLGEHAARLGLISPARAEKIASKKQAVEKWINKFEENGTALKMRRAGGLTGVSVPSAFMSLSKNAIDEVVYKLVYKGYLERDLRQIEKSSAYENVKIPESLDYSKVLGLRLEAGQKLASVRPSTVAQASRISGVSPADISVLLVHVKASK
ncbi:MAG: tRNA uridine-5-carboxymethylaminomethyl(34) synthesis enzyme MnmG [Opitutales bacterium]|nr:tRNA uridine-5-carboxymethylaminomethyl(34) synthesis enzyme MnmG [Opitutales bacterium]